MPWRRWVGAVAVIGVWQLGWSVDVIPPIALPSPLEIAIALWQLITSGELWFHLEATLPRLGIGWGLGALLGVSAGWTACRWSKAETFVTALVSSTAAVPAIALLPLFMIWLGAGEASMIGTIALAAFVPGARTTLAGASEAGNLPGDAIVDALRAALPVAMTVLVAVEMINGGFGIGALVFSAAELYRSDQIIAGCIVLAAIGMVLVALLRLIGRATAGGGR